MNGLSRTAFKAVVFSAAVALISCAEREGDREAGAEEVLSGYYVATDGDDRNLGTSTGQPLATIQSAVDRMKPGDICYVRGGTYREEIDLKGKAGTPGQAITLTSYQGEEVVLDGTVQIGAEWALDEGNVYKATLDRDITQLFVDGKLMTLARFPNALAFSDEVWHRTGARCQKTRESTNGHVVGAKSGARSIANAGISFDGCIALLNFGAHSTSARVVQNHSPGSAGFDYSPKLMKYKTTLNFFFEGGVGNAERRLLDIPQEWAFDETNKTAYLWADDGGNPGGREIRGKVQDYAVRGDAATKHIVIDGLNFFATAFSFHHSDDIRIQNCRFNYYAASKRALGDRGPSQTAEFVGSAEDFCVGNTVYNCEFRHADGSGLSGDYVENFIIQNNLFHQIDYACVNNDTGPGNPFQPSSAIEMNKVRNLAYRRNTLTVSGNAQSFSANRYRTGSAKRWFPGRYVPEEIGAIVCEGNFHTACGLQHTDGSSMYMPEFSAMESLIRQNWFIGNGQRDFRWDGDNKPLNGVHGNLIRNVSLGDGIKKMSPSGGNGFRVKGSYHEVYNNLGIGYGGELNIAEEKGGNAETVTRNNAATRFTGIQLGDSSHNYGDRRKATRHLKDMLRDYANWDFRPRSDAVELIDQGVPVECSVKGETFDVTAGFIGDAPDIGAYEFGDVTYWIPGRQEARASMPIPKAGAENVPLDADLMYLIGLKGVKVRVYFGTDPEALALIASKDDPQNIVTPTGDQALGNSRRYYWRVDTELADGSVVAGDTWSFSTAGEDPGQK